MTNYTACFLTKNPRAQGPQVRNLKLLKSLYPPIPSNPLFSRVPSV